MYTCHLTRVSIQVAILLKILIYCNPAAVSQNSMGIFHRSAYSRNAQRPTNSELQRSTNNTASDDALLAYCPHTIYTLEPTIIYVCSGSNLNDCTVGNIKFKIDNSVENIQYYHCYFQTFDQALHHASPHGNFSKNIRPLVHELQSLQLRGEKLLAYKRELLTIPKNPRDLINRLMYLSTKAKPFLQYMENVAKPQSALEKFPYLYNFVYKMNLIHYNAAILPTLEFLESSVRKASIEMKSHIYLNLMFSLKLSNRDVIEYCLYRATDRCSAMLSGMPQSVLKQKYKFVQSLSQEQSPSISYRGSEQEIAICTSNDCIVRRSESFFDISAKCLNVFNGDSEKRQFTEVTHTTIENFISWRNSIDNCTSACDLMNTCSSACNMEIPKQMRDLYISLTNNLVADDDNHIKIDTLRAQLLECRRGSSNEETTPTTTRSYATTQRTYTTTPRSYATFARAIGTTPATTPSTPISPSSPSIPITQNFTSLVNMRKHRFYLVPANAVPSNTSLEKTLQNIISTLDLNTLEYDNCYGGNKKAEIEYHENGNTYLLNFFIVNDANARRTTNSRNTTSVILNGIDDDIQKQYCVGEHDSNLCRKIDAVLKARYPRDNSAVIKTTTPLPGPVPVLANLLTRSTSEEDNNNANSNANNGNNNGNNNSNGNNHGDSNANNGNNGYNSNSNNNGNNDRYTNGLPESTDLSDISTVYRIDNLPLRGSQLYVNKIKQNLTSSYNLTASHTLALELGKFTDSSAIVFNRAKDRITFYPPAITPSCNTNQWAPIGTLKYHKLIPLCPSLLKLHPLYKVVPLVHDKDSPVISRLPMTHTLSTNQVYICLYDSDLFHQKISISNQEVTILDVVEFVLQVVTALSDLQVMLIDCAIAKEYYFTYNLVLGLGVFDGNRTYGMYDNQGYIIVDPVHVPPAYLPSVILHEFMHYLGFDHSSIVYSVMFNHPDIFMPQLLYGTDVYNLVTMYNYPRYMQAPSTAQLAMSTSNSTFKAPANQSSNVFFNVQNFESVISNHRARRQTPITNIHDLTASINNVEYIQNLQNLQNLQHLQNLQNLQNMRNLEHLRRIKHMEHIKHMERMEHLRRIRHMEHHQHLQHLRNMSRHLIGMPLVQQHPPHHRRGNVTSNYRQRRDVRLRRIDHRNRYTPMMARIPRYRNAGDFKNQIPANIRNYLVPNQQEYAVSENLLQPLYIYSN